MEKIRDIVLLEQLAHSIQNMLKKPLDRVVRDRAVARLAWIDQIIAARKDSSDCPGRGTCVYLED